MQASMTIWLLPAFFACGEGVVSPKAWLSMRGQTGLATPVHSGVSTRNFATFQGHSSLRSPSSRRNTADAGVHVVLCHSNRSDQQVHFLESRLRSKGYGVLLPDCGGDFAGQFISTKTGQAYKFWGRRLAHYREALKLMPSNSVALLLDVNDVLVMGGAEEALQRFREFGVPIVASCTEGMWPPPEDCPAYASVRSQFAAESSCRFPCAGAWMGTVAALQQLLAPASFNEMTNDQCWLHERLSTWPAHANWTLDTSGRLFLDGNRVPEGALRPGGGRYEVLGWDQPPSIIHLPGLHPSGPAMRELYALAAL
eukprot:CAMPEP_0117569134 /NCGR_PEP_ID=MMETSP0784-20121206/58501_1 /TAXON_ID=39447 /ORGANISM="" /LENGTH=310 /DNA_ID=CAMNT_0005367097 /DNA_START=32 /DNA_END=960 /DNA_ORIENTATION=+